MSVLLDSMSDELLEMSEQELQELIDALCNGTIDNDGMSRLENELKADRSKRDFYRRIMNLHTALLERCESDDDEVSISLPASDTRSRIQLWLLPIAAVAVLALVAVVAKLLVDPPPDNPDSGAGQADFVPPTHQREKGQGVAVLTQAVDVVWSAEGTPFKVGRTLPATTVILEAGLLHIDFVVGAYVTLEGPAKLELISENRGILHYGKLRAHVPEQAKGFTIKTSEAEFVDLGTEFGIECDTEGRSELHVFDGEVEVRGIDGGKNPPLLVQSGGGLRRVKNENWETIVSDSERFTDIETVARLAAESDSGRLDSWRRNHLELVKHPDLVAYYDFENPVGDSRVLPDLGPGGYHGAVVGCSRSEGRWADKGALEFKQRGDRVRVDIPGEFEALTMTTWLRIDGFDRLFNSILLSDRFDNGHAHWQVKQNGVIDLGVRPPGKQRIIYLSGRQLGQDDLGRWVHLAVTYDKQKRAVSHYVDGVLVARLPISESADFPLRFGPSEIGNWNPTTTGLSSPIRNLNGRMDELAIFSSALSESEISALFELGRP